MIGSFTQILLSYLLPEILILKQHISFHCILSSTSSCIYDGTQYKVLGKCNSSYWQYFCNITAWSADDADATDVTVDQKTLAPWLICRELGFLANHHWYEVNPGSSKVALSRRPCWTEFQIVGLLDMLDFSYPSVSESAACHLNFAASGFNRDT